MMILFTMETCGLCKTIKKELAKKNILFVECSTDVDAGLSNLVFYFGDGTTQLPAIVDKGIDDILFLASGIEAVREYINNKRGQIN